MQEYEALRQADERLRRRLWIALWVAAGLSYAAFTAAMLGPAWAHTTPTGMSFATWCCNGRDCQEIPKSAVEIDTQTGIVKVTLKPGDHPTVTQPHEYEFKYSEVRWSTDGLYYACLYPTEFTLRCLYLPPPSF